MSDAREWAEAFATFTPEELQRVCANFAEPKGEAVSMTTDAERGPRLVGPHGGPKGEMPSPTCADLIDPQFEAIWQATKSWDVNAPEYYEGYCGMNGSHVMLILNAVRAAGFEAAERAAEDFVDDYEFCGEDEDGVDSVYTPSEKERALIRDAVHGLLADEDFLRAMRAAK